MIDSDSDTDLMSNNMCTSTTISGKGPYTKNISLSFRNNALTSTMNMSSNIDRPWGTQSIHNQRCLNSRRETSPMSIRSAYDLQPRNFNHAYNSRGMISQRSVLNGRSGSPMSVRSIASNVSAVDIATAIKNAQFSKNDLRIIQDACNKYMNHRIPRRIAKRRKRNVFLKGARRRSSSESELSDLFISSDECKSTRTYHNRDNVSICRSTRTDISKIRRTFQEIDMYKDRSANFKQNSFRNKFSLVPANLNDNNNSQSNSLQSSMIQSDRFKSRLLLPSQRFNKSVAATAIPEIMDKPQNNVKSRILVTTQRFDKSVTATAIPESRVKTQNKAKNGKEFENNEFNGIANNISLTSESEQDEIFSDITTKDGTAHVESQQKQSLEAVKDISNNKRNKLSPVKKISDTKTNVRRRHNDIPESSDKADDLLFIKPSFPVRKPANMRKSQEKLIATSAQPLMDAVAKVQNLPKNHIHNTQLSSKNGEQDTIDNHNPPKNNSVSDVSMRPSFIKRKLFTQNLDIAENRNVSLDDPVNSPQTVYSAIQKEKNKTRKLVTTQSCLSRDVLQEGNNMLDLIHKIVPPDRMNVTNQTNKTRTEVHISKDNTDIEDKWDFSSIISTSKNDDMSDTYTDEEIFEDDNNNRNAMETINTNSYNNNTSKLRECKVVLSKINPVAKNTQEKQTNNKKQDESSSSNVAKKYIELFWDKGFESDLENQESSNRNKSLKETRKTVNLNKATTSHRKYMNPELKQNLPAAEMKSVLDNTNASIHRFNNTSLRIRSHRAPKRKQCCQSEETSSKCEPVNKSKKYKQDDSGQSNMPILNNTQINSEIQTVPKNSKNNHAKRKCPIPTEKGISQCDQSKFGTIQETISTQSSHIELSTLSVNTENGVKSNPIVNVRNNNTKRAGRTPKHNKQNIILKSDKANGQETSTKSRPIGLSASINTKTVTQKKLVIEDKNSSTQRSCRTPKQNKRNIVSKSDPPNFNNSQETNTSPRSKTDGLSVSVDTKNKPINNDKITGTKRSRRTPKQNNNRKKNPKSDKIKLNNSPEIITNSSNKVDINNRKQINVKAVPTKRVCRTPKEKNSDNKYKEISNIDQSVSSCEDNCRSLRSRNIDLSTSLTNLNFPIKIKPKNNIKVFNKNIEINSRKSDISFSLLSNNKVPAKHRRG